MELRSTWASRYAYKLHQYTQLSLGAIVEGGTCCVINGSSYQLQVGDIIVINAGAPHSCNPVGLTPRSYHMLYLDADWCQATLGESLCPLFSTHPVIKDAVLFQQYLDIVSEIQRNDTRNIATAIARLLRAIPGLQPTTATPFKPDITATFSRKTGVTAYA